MATRHLQLQQRQSSTANQITLQARIWSPLLKTPGTFTHCLRWDCCCCRRGKNKEVKDFWQNQQHHPRGTESRLRHTVMCTLLAGRHMPETRKLSYRKDDRAMRPTVGCPENVRESLNTPTTFPEISNGLMLRTIVWKRVQNLKSVAFPVPEIIAIEVLGGVANLQSWERGGRRWSGIVPFKRALVSSYRPSIVTFALSLGVSEILPLLYSSMPLFPTQPLVSPKSTHVYLGLGGWNPVCGS